MKKGDTCDLRSFQPLERHGTISLDLDMGRHIMDMAILIGKMMKMRLRTSGSKVFDVFCFFVFFSGVPNMFIIFQNPVSVA